MNILLFRRLNLALGTVLSVSPRTKKKAREGQVTVQLHCQIGEKGGMEGERRAAGTVDVCVEWTCCGLKEIFFRCPPSLGQQAAVTSIPAVLKAKLIPASP